MSQQDNLKVLYEAKGYPVFQNRMYDSYEEAIKCSKGDIVLVEDLATGLVSNAAFSPGKMTYDVNYQNEQGVSGLFQEHLSLMAKVIQKTIGKDNLVEVGCGKGFFLEMLTKQGFSVMGFDPTYEGNNPKIERDYFQPGLRTKAKGIILRHVLEHIQDPVSFLMHLAEANDGNGLVYIEVPCFDWICKVRAWFDIYYEHVNYFRMADFHRMFGRIIETGKAFGGQYLYIVADLASLSQPNINLHDRVCFPDNFFAKLYEDSILKNSVIWGAASKGVIFSFLKNRVGQSVDICIDINPAKQGKYLAATGLEVLSPDEGISRLTEESVVYVMNGNYLEEIKKMSNSNFNYVSLDHG